MIKFRGIITGKDDLYDQLDRIKEHGLVISDVSTRNRTFTYQVPDISILKLIYKLPYFKNVRAK